VLHSPARTGSAGTRCNSAQFARTRGRLPAPLLCWRRGRLVPRRLLLDTLLRLSRRGDIYRTLIRMRAAYQRNAADPQRCMPGRAGGRDVPHPIRVRRRSKPRSRLTQPEPTSGRASLHRYSPGGECDGNEYGGLPVNPVVLHQMNQLPIPRCTDGSNAPPNGPRGCLRCPSPVVNGKWRWLRRRSSTCRSRLCQGACRRETEASLAAAWRYG
jgi:hypothetical protein